MKTKILKNSYQKVNFKEKGKSSSRELSITARSRLESAFPLRQPNDGQYPVFEGQQTQVANRVADPKTGKDDLARAGQTEHEIFNKTQPPVCTAG